MEEFVMELEELSRNEKKHNYMVGFMRGKIDNILLHYNNGEDIEEISKHTGFTSNIIKYIVENDEEVVDEEAVYGKLDEREKKLVDCNVKMLYDELN